MLPLQSKVVAAPVIPQVAERLLEYHCGDEKRANAIICIVGCEYTSTCLVSIVNLNNNKFSQFFQLFLLENVRFCIRQANEFNSVSYVE